ncbi:MAG: OmpA family protein, partial [Saprospiraceae bacterium]
FIVLLTMFLAFQVSYAQHEGNHLLSYNFLFIDKYSPYANASDDGMDFSFDFRGKDALDESTQGVGVDYYYGVKNYLSIGAVTKFGAITSDTIVSSGQLLFGGLDLRAKFLLDLSEKQVVYPYVSTGLGGYLVEGAAFDMQIPVELGIYLRLAQSFGLKVSTEYRWSFDEIKDDELYSFTNNMVHSVGFVFEMGDMPEEKTPPPPVIDPIPEPEPMDTDGDGVADTDDNCPDEAGLAKFNGCPDTDDDGVVDADDECPELAGAMAFNGCPDTDNDGVADNKDDCPDEAGTLENNGCPIVVKDRDNDGVEDDKDNCPDTPGVAKFNGCPDTDGDGVADKDDKCPSSPGLVKFNGCPDTDGDGVQDSMDKCPRVAGLTTNKGCPAIKQEDQATLNFATQAVEFATGSATISTSSYSTLDKIAEIASKYPQYKMSISGHTDSVGSAETNQSMSERRAKACYDYMIKKGVSPSRISYAGYGESQPKYDNGTKDGRSKNRRVEFNLFL